MANEQNLIKGKDTQFREGNDAASRGRNGGIASGKARRQKKTLRDAVEALLEKKFTDKHGNKLTGTEILATELFKRAMSSDRAFEVLRDTAGQKPAEKVMVADVDAEVVAEVERMVTQE